MAKLHPFLRFNDGKCREAMEFYKGIFGGKVEYMTLGESPMAKEMPDKPHLIMHSALSSGDVHFYGSDMFQDRAQGGDKCGMALDCSSEEEVRTYFDGLKDNGEVFMEPSTEDWGGIAAMVTDKYGIEWILSFRIETYMKS